MRKLIMPILTFFLALALVSAYPISGNAIEAENETVNAGVTPDSMFYGIDVALDNINLALTSEDKKAEKGLEIARERLMEVRQMISENKVEESLRSQRRHEEALSKVERYLSNYTKENSTEEIEKEIEIEKNIKEHREEVEEIEEELSLKMKVEGEISNETQALIDSILSNLKNSTQRVEIKIEEEKGKTKIKIKNEDGRTEVEIEREFNEISERKGLMSFEKERAQEMLNKAEDKWLDLEEKAMKYNQTMPNRTIFNQHIALGNESFVNESYEEAKDHFEEAKDYAEDLKDDIEDMSEDFEDSEEEAEIEIEVRGSYSEVEVEYGEEEFEFRSMNTNRERIIQEISERTGLSIQQINSNLEFEYNDGKEKTVVKVDSDIELSQEVQETIISLVSSFKRVEGEFELELEVSKEDGETIFEAEVEEDYLTEEQQVLWGRLQDQIQSLVELSEEEDFEIEIEIEHDFELGEDEEDEDEDDDDDEDEEEDEENDDDDDEEDEE